jgi:hypothetical protein
MEPIKIPNFESPFYAVYDINNAMEAEIYAILDTKVAFGARLNVLDNVRFIISRTHDNLHNSVHNTMQEYFKKTPTK